MLAFVITLLFSFVFLTYSNQGQGHKSKCEEQKNLKHSQTDGTICVVVGSSFIAHIDIEYIHILYVPNVPFLFIIVSK